MNIYFAVEDRLSGAVIERLVAECLGPDIYQRELGSRQGGNKFIRSQLPKYLELALREIVLVLTDLDKTECAPSLRAQWLNSARATVPLPDNFIFCIAVREVEAWLLADRAGLANFLGINPNVIGRNIEVDVVDPKEYLLNLARRSRVRAIKDGLLPGPGNDAVIGLGYNTLLTQFVRDKWNPQVAAGENASLQRAMDRISAFSI